MEHQMIVREGIWDICSCVEIIPIFVALNNRLNEEAAMVGYILLCSPIVCNFLAMVKWCPIDVSIALYFGYHRF